MTNATWYRQHGSTARRLAPLALPLALLLLTGCPPRKPVTPIAPPPLLPLNDAIAAVNDNAAGITETLKASAPDVHAVFHDDQGRHTADFIGALRFLPPRHLYLKLSLIADPSAIELGSNPDKFWVAVKLNRNQLWWGRWSDLDPAEDYRMPLSPDMILAAIGLAPLPGPGEGLRGPVPLADDSQYYKLLYLADSGGALWIQREYRLDRFPPYLPRAVIFYLPDGTVRMKSTLDRYERVGASNVFLARRIDLEWPKQQDGLSLRIGSASFDPRIKADSPAFKIRSTIPRSGWVQVGNEPRPARPPASAPQTRPALEPESSPE